MRWLILLVFAGCVGGVSETSTEPCDAVVADVAPLLGCEGWSEDAVTAKCEEACGQGPFQSCDGHYDLHGTGDNCRHDTPGCWELLHGQCL